MNTLDATSSCPVFTRVARRRALRRALAALALAGLISCTPAPPVVPAPLAFDCEEIPEGAAGPTLLCESADGEVTVRIPWQGQALEVAGLELDDYWKLPAANDFTPLTNWPIVDLAITDAATGAAVVAFDPPMALTVLYGADEFAGASPAVGEGELGLGVWDDPSATWIVVGYGVFHEGYWLADPIAGGGLVLVTDVDGARPRYLMSGSPSGGQAATFVAASLPTLPLAWGALPPDPDHVLMEFDGPCGEVDYGAGTAIECFSTMAGLTVRVPLQAGGSVVPRVVALPWNRASTFEVAEEEQISPSAETGTLVRRLMNFLVEDAATGELLTAFDPPLEFEIAYTAQDKDPEVNPVLEVKYWDEYVEQWVVLGYGFTQACTEESGVTAGACIWGFADAAGFTDDPRFFGEGFFLTNPDGQGGIAKFTYDAWGDRMVAFGR